MRRIDLRVTGTGQRRAAAAAHRREPARRNAPAQPRRGGVRLRLCPALAVSSSVALAVPERRDSLAATLWNTPVYPRRRHRQRSPDSAAAIVRRPASCVSGSCRATGWASLARCRAPLPGRGCTRQSEWMATANCRPCCICDRFHFHTFVNPVVQSCTMSGWPVAVQQPRVPNAHAIPCAPMTITYRFAANPRGFVQHVVALQQSTAYADSGIHEHCDCCAASAPARPSSPPFRAGPRVGNCTGS
jgi:hypothetical protein